MTRRSSWTTPAQDRVVLEVAAGQTMARVAARHGLHPSQLATWCAQRGILPPSKAALARRLPARRAAWVLHERGVLALRERVAAYDAAAQPEPLAEVG